VGSKVSQDSQILGKGESKIVEDLIQYPIQALGILGDFGVALRHGGLFRKYRASC
jgi:hypothetical protein